MPFAIPLMMFVILVFMSPTAVLASPITTLSPQPAPTSHPSCPTTVVIELHPVNPHISTVYPSTSTLTREYDCHGCEAMVIVQLGHIFEDIPISPTATVTASKASTHIQPVCSSTPVNVHTTTGTASTTETAEYLTVTIGMPTSTLAVKREEDIEERQKPPGSTLPALCWNKITGLFDPAAPGCKITSRSQMEDEYLSLNKTDIEILETCKTNCTSTLRSTALDQCMVECISMATCGQKTTCPRDCWSPTTGLFDPAIPRCKITPRSQTDDDLTGVLPPVPANQTQTDIVEECTTICKLAFPQPTGLPYGVIVLEYVACVSTCVKQAGGSGPGIILKRAIDEKVETEIEERENSNENGTALCTSTCIGWLTFPPAPINATELAYCIAECVEAFPCGDVPCPIEKRDSQDQYKRKSVCYDKCITQYGTDPSSSEMHYCQIECAASGLGPVCVGDECPEVKRHD